MTPVEVRKFQGSALQATWQLPTDYFGEPLRVDGDFGPRTQWARMLAQCEPWRQWVVARGLREFRKGVREIYHDNRGPRIKVYLAVCSLPEGKPWCAAFVSWCYLRRCKPNAGALNLWRSLYRVRKPRPGDMFAYPVGSRGKGHCGLVLAAAGVQVMTLEGNQRDALRVLRRRQAGISFANPYDSAPQLQRLPVGLTLARGNTR